MTPKCPDCKRDQDECVCVDLEAENAALKEKVAELEAEHVAYKRATDLAYKGSELGTQQQLAASQLEAKRLRESPATKLIIEAYDFGQFSDDFNQPQARSVRKAIRELCEALSSPTSTEALAAIKESET